MPPLARKNPGAFLEMPQLAIGPGRELPPAESRDAVADEIGQQEVVEPVRFLEPLNLTHGAPEDPGDIACRADERNGITDRPHGGLDGVGNFGMPLLYDHPSCASRVCFSRLPHQVRLR